MTPKSHFPELDETIVFSWIEEIRCCSTSELEKKRAEAGLFQLLDPISNWFAHLRKSPAEYDAEQVVNDSICQFILVYVRNPNFEFHSSGHLVCILGRITTNQRRMAYRRNNILKRAPRDLDGHSIPFISFDILECTCQSTSEDPSRKCEQQDEVERYLGLLDEVQHQRVLQLLLADFTWSEIGTKLDVNQKAVRQWVTQIRRILTPHTSHLTPHTSHLTPHTSHLTPHTSHLTPHTRYYF